MVGPTAVGKSALSQALADDIFEIISADSVQVYRYLDIGSSKPGREIREKIGHHLIDIVNPDCQFTAGDFCREALRAAGGIVERGKLPMIAGGTGLYIDSFFRGMAEIPPVEKEIKERLVAEMNERGLPAMYDELRAVDRDFASTIHANDRQRILRGLEVYRSFGRPMSSYFETTRGHESPDTLYLGLFEERELLRTRIDARVERMMSEGLVDEVAGIRRMGYGPDLNSMKSIGYREINGYLDGALSLPEAVDGIKTGTKQYAKRQMTWFGKNKKIAWFRPEELPKIRDLVEKWLNK